MLQVSLAHLKPSYSYKSRTIVFDAALKHKAISFPTPQGNQYECENYPRLWWRGTQGIIFAFNHIALLRANMIPCDIYFLDMFLSFYHCQTYCHFSLPLANLPLLTFYFQFLFLL